MQQGHCVCVFFQRDFRFQGRLQINLEFLNTFNSMHLKSYSNRMLMINSSSLNNLLNQISRPFSISCLFHYLMKLLLIICLGANFLNSPIFMDFLISKNLLIFVLDIHIVWVFATVLGSGFLELYILNRNIAELYLLYS